MPPRNLTGFDVQKFAAAAGQPVNDPWRKGDLWRYTGPFTRRNRLKGAFPGLGIGAGAFAVYLVYEAIFLRDKHGHGEGKDHHTMTT